MRKRDGSPLRRQKNVRVPVDEIDANKALADELGIPDSEVYRRGAAMYRDVMEQERKRLEQERTRRETRGLSADPPVDVGAARREQLAERPAWQGRFTSAMAAAVNGGGRQPVWTEAEKASAGKFTYYSPRPRFQSYGQRKVESLLTGLLGPRKPSGMREFELLPRRERPVHAIEEKQKWRAGF